MYLTENGNLLRTTDTANIEQAGFWSLKGQFLRIATPSEVCHLKDILPYVVYTRKNEPRWQEIAYWEFMWKITNTDERNGTTGSWEYFTRLLSDKRREYICVKWDEIESALSTYRLTIYGMKGIGLMGSGSCKEITIDELGVRCSLDDCLKAVSSVLINEPDAQWAPVLNTYDTMRRRIMRLNALGIDRKARPIASKYQGPRTGRQPGKR